MNTVGRILWGALTIAAGASALLAESLPTPEQVLTTLRRVNDRFLLNWPDPAPDIVTDRARPSNIWTRATYFEGLMALHAIDPDARYYDYAVRWGQSHNWQPAYGSADPRHADNQCCGQTYLDLYALDPRPERLAGIKAAIDLMVGSTKSDDWWWIDALQMSMPVFTRLGVQLGDPRYFEKMHALYTHTKRTQGGRGLYNPVEHLWWRDADFDPPYLEPNGANCYWSRGNGWVFAGLARVLERLPVNDPHRAEYLRDFQDMAAALAPLQRIDGFWNVSLKDPGNYGGRELTGTAFFTYGMAWGIRRGHLSRSTYLPVVTHAWRALANLAVRADGTLGYVQGSGKQPSDGQPVTYDSRPNFDDFGTGAFLLAGSEVYRITRTPAIDTIGIWKSDRVNAGYSSPPTPGFSIELRGTALAQLPPGTVTILHPAKGEIAVANAAVGFQYGAVSRPALSAAYPNGVYTVLVAGRKVADVQVGLASGSPDEFAFAQYVSVEATNHLRPVVIESRTPAPAADTEMRLRLVTGAVELESRAGSGRPRFELPSCTFDGPGYVAFGLHLEQLTSRNRDVDLGTLGRATVEGGIRGSTYHLGFTLADPANVTEKLINLSSRGRIPAGGELIAGFTVSGGGAKMVLIRAVGPSLQNFGVADPLPNPLLRVYNANRTRSWQNDDWQGSSQYFAHTTNGGTALQAGYSTPRDLATATAEAGAFPLGSRSRDAALVLVLPPGNYTAQATTSGPSAEGQALVEVYELATTEPRSRLTNLSTRGAISSTVSLTTGFVITGGPKQVLARAIGPTLAMLGLPADSVLRDPLLTIFDQAGQQLAQNDDWGSARDQATLTAFRAAAGAFPLQTGTRDAEIVLMLDPGAYTLRVSSGDGSSGTALAEVYVLTPGS